MIALLYALLLQAAPEVTGLLPIPVGAAAVPAKAQMARDIPEHPMQVRIDPAASQALFTVHTLWLSSMDGHFDPPEGTLENLPDGRQRVRVSLRAASVLFPESARTTRWTRSVAFFDVANFPLILFRSEPFPADRLRSGGPFDGVLELRGTSKPVRFTLSPSACAQPGVACPIHVVGSISRREFGMARMMWLVRDEVEFTFDVRLQGRS